jgi:hypothetical protein
VTELAWGLIEALPELIDSVFILVDNIVDFLTDPESLAMLISAAIELVLAIGNGIIKAIPQLLVDVGALLESVKKRFTEFDWASLGKNLVAGFKKGISNAWKDLKTWFEGLFENLIEVAEKILGIASPSKVFKKIGKFVDQGLEIGLEQNADAPLGAIEDISNQMTSAFNPDLMTDYTTSYSTVGSYGGNGSSEVSENASSVSITFGEKAFYIANFNGNSESEVDNFVDAVIDKLTSKIQSREAVFA